MKKVEILDCTLRDASYPIAYQFTAEDTAVIAAGLESAGIRRIEIGHGLGLAASRQEFGFAAATDEEYMAAAASVLTKAKFGMFMIPGIADLSHIDIAAKYKAGFVRVGTDVNKTEQAETFIKRAKDKGLEVSANLMKTYGLGVDEVVRRSVQLESWGADVISVVDSAGGMLPSEVSNYVKKMSQAVKAKIGFHGHNNTQLAVANTIMAVEAGATVVDCTLRGMGRSSGNAQLEAVIMLLKRMGIETGLDEFRLMDLAEKLIGPIAQGRGVDSVELVSGYALFHSSYMKIINTVAKEKNVDPRKLIIAVCEQDKLHVTKEGAAAAADKLAKEAKSVEYHTPNLDFSHRAEVGGGSKNISESAKAIAAEMNVLSKKMAKRSVFTISIVESNEPPSFPFLRTNSVYVIGNAELRNLEQAAQVAKAVDGTVNVIMVDLEAGPDNLLETVKGAAEKSLVLSYRDSNGLIDSAEALLNQLATDLRNKTIGVAGVNSLGMGLVQRLVQRGLKVAVWDKNPARAKEAMGIAAEWGKLTGSNKGSMTMLDEATSVDVLIGAYSREGNIGPDQVAKVAAGGTILDMGAGSFSKTALEKAIAAGLNIYRVDMRAGLNGQISTVIETADLVRTVIGKGKIAGVDVIAGGYIGQKGTVVVDTINEPSRVVGVADGHGRLLNETESQAYMNQISKVKSELIKMRLP